MICTLLRKPLYGGGILNALPCGGMNIESSRVPIEPEDLRKTSRPNSTGKILKSREGDIIFDNPRSRTDSFHRGRFPANLIFSPESALALDTVVGWIPGRGNVNPTAAGAGNGVIAFMGRTIDLNPLFDAGGFPSRFFRIVPVTKPGGLDGETETLGRV